MTQIDGEEETEARQYFPIIYFFLVLGHIYLSHVPSAPEFGECFDGENADTIITMLPFGPPHVAWTSATVRKEAIESCLVSDHPTV